MTPLPDLSGVHCLLSQHEQETLYRHVLDWSPNLVLEIGCYQGGSSEIIASALVALGKGGRMISVDPHPDMKPERLPHWAQVGTLIEGESPAAVLALDELFELVFIDGLHNYDGVMADIDAARAVSAPGALWLFHDAHYHEVERAIQDTIAANHDVVDLGLVCHSPHVSHNGVWGGIYGLLYMPEGDK